jgi:type II secretion system protein H
MRTRRQRGFTFVELIVVVVIISAAAALATPRIKNAFDGFLVSSAARQVFYAVQYAQERAVSRGAVHRLSWDESRGVVWIEAQSAETGAFARIDDARASSRKLPKEVVLRAEPQGTRVLYCYPDGSFDSDIVFRVRGRGRQETVKVQGGSGEVQVQGRIHAD